MQDIGRPQAKEDAPAPAIRAGIAADAAALAEFAALTFADAFAAVNDPGDMAHYLSTAYGLAQQSAELADPGIATLLAEAGGRLAGFAQVRGGPPPSCITGARPLELWRFYVDRAWQGRGVAKALMDAACAEAARRGGATLWLGVWERNDRARAFYRKCGFVELGRKSLVLGHDVQTDLVMARQVTT